MDGIGLTISAGLYDSDAVTSTDGRYVIKSGGGLGVDDETCFPSFGCGFIFPSIAGLRDLLTLTFDRDVVLNLVTFTERDAGGDDDVDLFVDGILFKPDVNIPADSTLVISTTAVQVIGRSFSFGADDAIPFGESDNFLIGSVTVTEFTAPVPAPMTAALLVSGMGILLAAKRRKERG